MAEGAARAARRNNKAPGQHTSRYDSSLGLLTKKFCKLVEDADDGVLDLNKAAEALSVQKRRIYDITNVLEGIGLIEKKSKNNIQWKGAGGSEASEAEQQQAELRQQVAQLQADERLLGGHIAALQDSIRTMADCPANRSRLYVTDTDIAALPSVAGDTVFAVKAPMGTELSVPDFESDADAPKQYKIVLNSHSEAPIEVWLVSASTRQAQNSQPSSTTQAHDPKQPFAEGRASGGAIVNGMVSPGLLRIQNHEHDPDAWYEHEAPPSLGVTDLFFKSANEDMDIS